MAACLRRYDEMSGMCPRGEFRAECKRSRFVCFILDVSHLLYIIHVGTVSRDRDCQRIFDGANQTAADTG